MCISPQFHLYCKLHGCFIRSLSYTVNKYIFLDMLRVATTMMEATSQMTTRILLRLRLVVAVSRQHRMREQSQMIKSQRRLQRKQFPRWSRRHAWLELWWQESAVTIMLSLWFFHARVHYFIFGFHPLWVVYVWFRRVYNDFYLMSSNDLVLYAYVHKQDQFI